MTKQEILRNRYLIIREIREFFHLKGFIEINTPTLVPNPGLEPHLNYFETEFIPDMGGGRRQTFYLPTSPEYHLKKALAQGHEKIFEVARSFRNGEWSGEHEPEFLMLEWYRNPGSYKDIANDFGQLLSVLGRAFAPSQAWGMREDLSVEGAFSRFANLDLRAALNDEKSLAVQCQEKQISSVHPEDSFDTAFFKVMIEKIEPKLGFNGPFFLWDYPRSQAALSRVKTDDPLYCERFEVYWKGIELANAFGELTDSVEQRKRCVEDQKLRLEKHRKSPPLDEEFLKALDSLKGDVGGVAVGLDRLIQCLLGQPRLQDVVAFPYRN